MIKNPHKVIIINTKRLMNFFSLLIDIGSKQIPFRSTIHIQIKPIFYTLNNQSFDLKNMKLKHMKWSFSRSDDIDVLQNAYNLFHIQNTNYKILNTDIVKIGHNLKINIYIHYENNDENSKKQYVCSLRKMNKYISESFIKFTCCSNPVEADFLESDIPLYWCTNNDAISVTLM